MAQFYDTGRIVPVRVIIVTKVILRSSNASFRRRTLLLQSVRGKPRPIGVMYVPTRNARTRRVAAARRNESSSARPRCAA